MAEKMLITEEITKQDLAALEAKDMKRAALKYLRFQRRCFAIATEYGRFSADVIGMNATAVYEIEVKRTKSDFTADFRKESKHRTYSGHQSPTKYEMRDMPTYFYYLVPKEWASWAVAQIVKRKLPYGVMGYYSPTCVVWGMEKRSAKLPGRPNDELLTTLMLRMSSELIRAYDKEKR